MTLATISNSLDTIDAARRTIEKFIPGLRNTFEEEGTMGIPWRALERLMSFSAALWKIVTITAGASSSSLDK
jgi:hypothetical protein